MFKNPSTGEAVEGSFLSNLSRSLFIEKGVAYPVVSGVVVRIERNLVPTAGNGVAVIPDVFVFIIGTLAEAVITQRLFLIICK